MSPSWRERVRIALLPHEVAMVRLARGLQPRIIDRKCIPCPAAADRASWASAVDALHELLAHPNVGRGEVTLILSSHFTRYLIVPWSAELVTLSEELELARARFVQVHGQAAHDWSIAMNPSPAGAGRLCAAMDQALILAVRSAVAASALRLRSVQPALMALFNESRRRVGDDGWVVVAEQGRLLVAWISGGQWRSVRARPLNGATVKLAQVLEQEQLLLSAGGGQKVFLATLGEVPVDAEGLRIERLAPARTAQAPAEAGYTLAMCGP